ncbi:putative MFS siderophore iron transporter [Aspergillus clavatus NRRL 1]|uniref:Siderochrome-iron transporter, putative n=1 Tax=Aspergillus clavatus (strain ATCC 1007 / CBS 513.65 / DSM 816 / NCTC 3887 / NRRL 1 / QM 1276 / 107) TaxID=344612 RepID=A1CC81_ASPCL|nr:siderochrome-iron transporter, putative [Aspergillus clavatus NRRL 1]EAW12138.1 siderochrome-iron transporter, putative [Aspergillus clavatus NRRL 1]
MPSSWQKKFFQSADSAATDVPSTSQPPLDYGATTMEGATMPGSKGAVEVVNSDASEEVPDEKAQAGVKEAEAITLTWTKASLAAAYILMWSLYCVNAFQSSITGNLSSYVTSGFESHSLIPVIYIVSSAMSAATYMPLAKILNLWDRSVGFLLMVIIATIGLILSATCHNIATYCASQVFYSVGFAGIIFSIDVITIDTSSLRDRGLAFAFTSSPYIITAFAGPAAAEQFYESNWRWAYGCFAIVLPVMATPMFVLLRWAYGCFAIVLPVMATPMFVLLRWNRSKAKKMGVLQEREPSGRTWIQSIIFYVIEFDLLGVILLAAGLVLFLLPFSIAGSAEDDWRTAHIIVMLVIGVACLIAFALVERFVAPVPFLPWPILASRTVLGACLVDVCYQIAYYCWFDYYSSYLQVVYGTSITVSGYIVHIFDVVSGVWLICVGLLIRKTGRFRWLLFAAVPLYLLGEGLMIYFRKPNWSVGYTIMCQIFIAFAGGTMIICQQVAVLSATDHNNAASALAFLNVFGTMGSAVGSSISGAIWTHTLPGALQRLLPEAELPNWESIYEDLAVQLSYERGSAARQAIALAYADAQSKMLIAGTCIMALSLIWMFVIRDIKLTNSTQTKGVLF